MHAPRRRDDAPTRQPAARQAPQSSRTPGPVLAAGASELLARQRATGNAAVVQMLRRAGHGGGEAERHAHGPDCGHAAAGPAAVQRSAVHDVLRGSGRPLDDGVRGEMEARLGADFSDVRLHTDHAARASAREIGARAYTSGSHIVVGSGGGDRHTLAHELTHVIQQRQGPVSGTDHGDGLAVSDPGDRFERAAEANATRALAGPVPDVRRALPRPSGGTGGPTAVQRYTTGGRVTGVTGESAAQHPNRTKGVDHFLTQGSEAVLRPGESPNKLIKAQVDPAKADARADVPLVDHMDIRMHQPFDVSLLISDDGTLAVHDTDREPKEFYASQQAFTQANADLLARGSAYTLVQSGGSVRTAGGELKRVTPVVNGEEDRARAEGFADLVKHQCIDVARKVIGTYAMEIALQGTTTDETAPWSQDQGTAIAERLTAAVHAPTGNPAPGNSAAERYGSTLRTDPAASDAAAQELGVNNHARPEVGEAFATLSIGSDQKIDYATAAPGTTSTDHSDVDVWNYHFAGVVARSGDGNDWVTLENYTRNQQAQKAMQDLEAKLLDAYRRKTVGWFRNKEGRTPKGRFESERIIEMIQELAATTRAKAVAEYNALSVAQEAWQSKWFFRMYGSGAGQRFHERQYAGGQGDFVNPLTIRTRRPPAE
ncbi:DUF4157 domain-containing protein [Streptomyces sp. NPDC090106]|uniref:DUF4157 domain-containing protein n=1 Tax=Streptomyces sp. NPDC090106 TaxID=3365946 RepID=UPI003816C921